MYNPIVTGDEHHDGTRLFDIEGDGDLDIASIGFTHGRMMVYENLTQHDAVPPAVVVTNSLKTTASDPVPPARLVLSPNYPNPFNPSITIGYELPRAARVNLAIYDVRGSLVARLVDGEQPAGRHEVVFEPRGLASGVYLAHLKVGGQVLSVLFLYKKSNEKEARKAFKMIADSLKKE